jgi:Flp pilus assembly protein TadG
MTSLWVMAMAMKSMLVRLRNQIRRFAAARDGNMAITFGLLSLPVVVAMGGAVDYTRANAIKADLQSALDATALMVSKSAGSMTTDQVQSAAQNYFAALFNNPAGYSYTVTATLDTAGSSLTLDGVTTVKTEFLHIYPVRLENIDVKATATAKWGTSRLRVALVLDVSGSMLQASKLPTLKTAAKNLLTQLQGAATTNGDVYVSIIPFNKMVNIGKNTYQQAWLRWDLWEQLNGSCSKSSNKTKTTCTLAGGTWTAANHTTWSGCVTDRDQDYDTTNTAPSTAVTGTLIPASEYGLSYGGSFFNFCPDEMMSLSYDWAALKAKIDSLDAPALGTTNQAIGLQWGFQSLTASPFTIPPKNSNYTYSEVIILMSDGLNTENRWYTFGQSGAQAAIDAREQITCNNVKAKGIIVYTIHVNTDGDPTSTLLRNCATTTDKFFLLTSADQMVTTFNTIGVQLTSLRLAK